MSKELEILERRLQRERAARKQAEAILEKKAKELYEVNQSLEQQVQDRTAALEKSEQQYRSIIESADDIIYNIDANGNFSFVNPAGLHYTGYTEEEVIGKSFNSIIRNDFKEQVQTFYLDVLQNSKEKTYFEFPIITKSGDTLWIGQNVKLLKGPDGIMSFTVLARDITKRKIAEAAAKKLTAEIKEARHIAENAQKAEAMFLANMSHEMRTPLNAIIGMSHLLQDATLNGDEQEYLEILSSSANVLQNLISDVLDISKIDAGKLELQKQPFDLLKLITNLERTFAVKLEQKNVKIKTVSDVKLQHLLVGDELILNQIFLNLLSNAEKFTNEGEIIIRLSEKENSDTQITIQFSVEDTGIGMSKEQIDKIFEQFKQASSEIRQEYGGTGLGLAITKKLITLLDSDIKVKSKEDQGTTFFFTLSFEKSDIETNTIKEKANRKLEFSSVALPVLVVEDNAMNQKYITRLLEKWQLDYHLAHNGQEAWDLSLNHKYAMIFMDFQMPVMNGYEATAKIRVAENPNFKTPIIALTASTLLSKKQNALDSGMDDFLSKPFNPNQLSDIIAKHLPQTETPKNTVSNMGQSKTSFKFNPQLDQEYLNSIYLDDLEYYLDILNTFMETIPVEIKEMKKASDNKNHNDLNGLLHKLKPTFTMVGASNISVKFENMEKLGKTNSPTVFEKIDILLEEVDHLMTIISSEKTELENHLNLTILEK